MKIEKPHILIIDDDIGVLFLHDIILTESRLIASPLSFSNAESGLEYLKSQDYPGNRALIFLDINMPKMNGWQFLDHLEKEIKHVDVKVVMVTSSLSKAEKEKSKEYCRVIDFWEKPMEEVQVHDLVDRLGDWL